MTVPNSPINGAVEPMVARPPRPRFSLAWTMASDTFESALAGFHLLLGNSAAAAVIAELLQTGGDNFSQMRFLVAVGDLDRLVQTAFLQSAGNAGERIRGDCLRAAEK